jgi:hypothetical protein
VPAARATPLVAEKIVRNYEPVWAVHVADPRLAGRKGTRTDLDGMGSNSVSVPSTPSLIPTTPTVVEAQEVFNQYTSQPPSSSAQTDLNEILRSFQKHPVQTAKTRKLMERQVELLTKLEGRLPGFSEELMRRFMGNLAGELRGGVAGDIDQDESQEARDARRAKALAQMKARSQLFRKLQEDPLISSRQAAARAAASGLSPTSANPTEALLARISVPHWSSGTLYCREKEVVAAVQPVAQNRNPSGAPPEPKGAFYFTPPQMPGMKSEEMKPGTVDATAYLYNSMMEEFTSSL